MKTKPTIPSKKTPSRKAKTNAPPLPAAPKRTARSGKAAPQAQVAHLAPVAAAAPPAPSSKKGTIEALMRRPEGTAITDLMAATGWQEHSIRAALTGLRKAGCTITRDRNDGATRYRIVGAA